MVNGEWTKQTKMGVTATKEMSQIRKIEKNRIRVSNKQQSK
jgi:hypothetical protein